VGRSREVTLRKETDRYAHFEEMCWDSGRSLKRSAKLPI
jgi:hypothetical protein